MLAMRVHTEISDGKILHNRLILLITIIPQTLLALRGSYLFSKVGACGAVRPFRLLEWPSRVCCPRFPVAGVASQSLVVPDSRLPEWSPRCTFADFQLLE